ncbi:MAG: LPS export ABC transporter periplasmic protein LptC [bacterium]|nr:LPS export ABC transporter periplasmic protein LptC [bacterium]
MKVRLFPVLCILFLGCSSVEEPGKMASKAKQPPDQEIWNGTIEVTENGLTQSIIKAGHIELYEDTRVTLLDSGVVVDFFNKKGQHASVLTSLAAKIEEKHDIFLATGNVIVISDSGAMLRTERLYWDRKNRQIRSDTLVTMTSAFDSLRGYEFDAKEDLSSWQLKRPTGQTFRQVQK